MTDIRLIEHSDAGTSTTAAERADVMIVHVSDEQGPHPPSATLMQGNRVSIYTDRCARGQTRLVQRSGTLLDAPESRQFEDLRQIHSNVLCIRRDRWRNNEVSN